MPLDSIKLPEYKELIDHAVNWGYGTMHTHEEIAEIMHLSLSTYAAKQKYHNMVVRANKKLVENSRMLVNVKGKGYKVVEPDEYIHMSCKEVKKATTRFRRAYKISNYAPTEDMTPEGRRQYTVYHDRLGVLSAMNEGTQREIIILSKQPLKLNSGRN
ncbi:MAG: hypothetical protein WCY05_06590 [Candidatus Omnitrophota bacterium]